MTTPALITFLRGQLSLSDLPEKIELDKHLWQVMDELWQRSIQYIDQRRVSEWGGVLVLDELDNLKLINITKGTDQHISLRIPIQLTFVGSFHTHPYIDGTTGIAFSGADIADAINNREIISIVQSGRDVFVLMGANKVPSQVNRTLLKYQHTVLHHQYLSEGMSDRKAVYYANLDICEAYHLTFYTGQVFSSLWEVYQP